MAVKRAFSSAIVYSARLAKGKVDLLVLFMIDNHMDLFKVSHNLNPRSSLSVKSGASLALVLMLQVPKLKKRQTAPVPSWWPRGPGVAPVIRSYWV